MPGCFNQITISCSCFVSLPLGSVGWSGVFDFGISRLSNRLSVRLLTVNELRNYLDVLDIFP